MTLEELDRWLDVDATYSNAKPTRQNVVYNVLSQLLEATVDVPFRDVTFEGVPDPRVSVVDAGTKVSTTSTEVFLPAKYPAFESPIPVGRWEEAQLIVAEADVAAGDVGGAVGIINTLHANAGIPAFAGGTPEEVQAQIIEERRREFFLEGQRLGDIIHYALPLFPATDAVPGGRCRLGHVRRAGVLPVAHRRVEQQPEHPGLK